MKYAVIQTGGKQYKAEVGSVLEIEKLEGEAESMLEFANVLFLADEGNFQVGKPFLSEVSISAKILEQKKGKKIRVAKFKAKSRYRKVTGHRQLLTRVKIEKISVSNKKESKSAPSTEIKDKKSNIKKTNKK